MAVHYADRSQFTGSVHAFGGAPLPEIDRPDSVGGAGTVFWKARDQAFGDLEVDNFHREQSTVRTPFRSVGSGIIQTLQPTTLTAETEFITSDTGLEGLWVVVNAAELSPFRIVSNTSTALETDPGSGDMTTVGAPGDSYQGATVLDNLTVTRMATVTTGGDLIIIATGSVTVNEGGLLLTPPVVKWP